MRERDRVLVLADSPTPTTVDQNYEEELRAPDWKTEANVVAALHDRGHPCRLLGIHDELDL
ncbi:hypothetical protein HQ590_06880, partial [bacterium]|nr:hypothetical protein [bacterium]